MKAWTFTCSFVLDLSCVFGRVFLAGPTKEPHWKVKVNSCLGVTIQPYLTLRRRGVLLGSWGLAEENG